ncbi:hypothetical protein FRACA_320029 [Frankia canadensis]|uniref:Uncharacterized protein n=1 Tax=Frankia canadensis TaxID=1836972 RepID=A0A2I2KUJ3_9ACTN|nr:hypothetical protein FRACA_320029 [Frankia canadensis]SOU56620.1 hypothetical protein FRACA_320029 [Frankia canadensis]
MRVGVDPHGALSPRHRTYETRRADLKEDLSGYLTDRSWSGERRGASSCSTRCTATRRGFGRRLRVTPGDGGHDRGRLDRSRPSPEPCLRGGTARGAGICRQQVRRCRGAGAEGPARRERIFAAPGERWFAEDRPIRRVHADASMFVGGLRACCYSPCTPWRRVRGNSFNTLVSHPELPVAGRHTLPQVPRGRVAHRIVVTID